MCTFVDSTLNASIQWNSCVDYMPESRQQCTVVEYGGKQTKAPRNTNTNKNLYRLLGKRKNSHRRVLFDITATPVELAASADFIL